jgi:hypothetical protein
VNGRACRLPIEKSDVDRRAVRLNESGSRFDEEGERSKRKRRRLYRRLVRWNGEACRFYGEARHGARRPTTSFMP